MRLTPLCARQHHTLPFRRGQGQSVFPRSEGKSRNPAERPLRGRKPRIQGNGGHGDGLVRHTERAEDVPRRQEERRIVGQIPEKLQGQHARAIQARPLPQPPICRLRRRRRHRKARMLLHPHGHTLPNALRKGQEREPFHRGARHQQRVQDGHIVHPDTRRQDFPAALRGHSQERQHARQREKTIRIPWRAKPHLLFCFRQPGQ